ncbi:hypothetical protein [Pseudomonas sp. PDM31]|uniref:hypothetical protein n=1 Tax=Pseudomonas sp. PDM31 TaxID=2854778 RepID=UPI001C44F1B8|nr:hypothetical protein [Pseudomonas sp. PDM31]MBV7477620.1 hypothetical protein [Pseudomonas sp. PDM31]
MLAEEIVVCRKARLPVITSNVGNPGELIERVPTVAQLLLELEQSYRKARGAA